MKRKMWQKELQRHKILAKICHCIPKVIKDKIQNKQIKF